MNNEDLKIWSVSNGTKEFIRSLEDRKQQVMENWAAGMYVYGSNSETIQKNAEAIGIVTNINEILEAISEAGHEI